MRFSDQQIQAQRRGEDVQIRQRFVAGVGSVR